MYVCHVYVGGCLGVGACPAVGVGNPAGSGGGRLGVFDFRVCSPVFIVQFLYPCPDFSYTFFSVAELRILIILSTQFFRVAGLWISSTQISWGVVDELLS